MPTPRPPRSNPSAAHGAAGTIDEAEAIAEANAAGLDAARAVPPGMVCGSGAIMRPGEEDWVNDPLLESPFGQDYNRHVAFVEAAMHVLQRHGVEARARVLLD